MLPAARMCPVPTPTRMNEVEIPASNVLPGTGATIPLSPGVSQPTSPSHSTARPRMKAQRGET